MSSQSLSNSGLVRRRASKESYHRRRRLLRTRCERPRRRRAAEQRDKLAASQLIEMHRADLRKCASALPFPRGSGSGQPFSYRLAWIKYLLKKSSAVGKNTWKGIFWQRCGNVRTDLAAGGI
jgi:hypothetical protein